MNKVCDQRNHTELSISGTKGNGTCDFQKWSIPTVVRYSHYAH